MTGRGGTARRVIIEAALIVILAAAAGLVINSGLLVRYHRGEFDRGFVAASTLESLVFIDIYQAQELWQDRRAQFIDARPARVFADGHIPFAVNIPPDRMPEEGGASRLGLDPEKPAVVYCSGGECLDSIRLALWLKSRKAAGDVRIFRGGWQEWVEAGLPIETSHGAK